jgi:hypothetical protein
MKKDLTPKGIMIDQKTRDAWNILKANSINISCLLRNYIQKEALKYGGSNDR